MYWENGALWKRGGREVAEKKGGRKIFDEAPGVSLMRCEQCEGAAFFLPSQTELCHTVIMKPKT